MKQRYFRKTDIIFSILTRWKLLLISACFGAVVGGLCGYLFALNFDYSASYIVKLRDKYLENMTEDEIEAVESWSTEYESEIDSYVNEMQFKYLSVIGLLDYEAIDTLTLEYHLTGSYDDLETFTGALRTYIYSDDFVDLLRESMDEDIYRTYLRQLLTTKISANKETFTVVFWGDSKGMCNDVSAVFGDTLNDEVFSLLEMEELEGSVTLALSEETLTSTSSSTVQQKQESHAETLLTAQNTIKELSGSLSRKEKQYFFADLAYRKGVAQIFSDNVSTGYYRIRYSVLGLILSVIAVVIYLSIRVIFSDKLVTAYELQETKNIRALGFIIKSDGQRRKLIKRFYGKHGECKKKYIHDNIKECLDQNEIEAVLVLSSSNASRGVCRMLAKNINNYNEIPTYTDLQECDDIDGDKLGVIFVETVGNALFSDVIDEIDSFQNSVTVGYIAVL